MGPVARNHPDGRNRTVGLDVDVNRVMADIASRMWNPKNRPMLPWNLA